MNIQSQSKDKRIYFPVLVNGRIKYIRDRKHYRESNPKLQKQTLCSERR